MLTNAAVKAARPRAAAYKLSDERGLHLFVAPNGRKTFRWRFRWEGREQLLTIGAWPEVALDAARARAQLAREQLERSVDPRNFGAAAPEVHRFDEIGRRWHSHMLPRWTAVHAGDVLASLERDVFPAIGAMPIGAITVPVVLNALRSVEAARLSRDGAPNPPADLGGLFLRDRRGPGRSGSRGDRRARADAAGAGAPPSGVAGDRRCARAARGGRAPRCRTGDKAGLALPRAYRGPPRGGTRRGLVGDRGSGRAAPIWRVPAARMKLAVAKKRSADNDHIVPLSKPGGRAAARGSRLGPGDGLIFPGSGDRADRRGGDRRPLQARRLRRPPCPARLARDILDDPQ